MKRTNPRKSQPAQRSEQDRLPVVELAEGFRRLLATETALSEHYPAWMWTGFGSRFATSTFSTGAFWFCDCRLEISLRALGRRWNCNQLLERRRRSLTHWNCNYRPGSPPRARRRCWSCNHSLERPPRALRQQDRNRILESPRRARGRCSTYRRKPRADSGRADDHANASAPRPFSPPRQPHRTATAPHRDRTAGASPLPSLLRFSARGLRCSSLARVGAA